MRQLTIYLDSGTERRIRLAAKSAKMSLSKWVASLVRERTDKTWPHSVVALSGAWADFPPLEKMRKHGGADAEREAF